MVTPVLARGWLWLVKILDRSPASVTLFFMKVISEIARDALELPSDQRLTLARMLLDCSDAEIGVDQGVGGAWESEIASRIEGIRNGTAKYRSADKVFADLDDRFPG